MDNMADFVECVQQIKNNITVTLSLLSSYQQKLSVVSAAATLTLFYNFELILSCLI